MGTNDGEHGAGEAAAAAPLQGLLMLPHYQQLTSQHLTCYARRAANARSPDGRPLQLPHFRAF
eukprot:scaffold120338_cov22-Tisochrysis_lutea.AAC.2